MAPECQFLARLGYHSYLVISITNCAREKTANMADYPCSFLQGLQLIATFGPILNAAKGQDWNVCKSAY